jgi:hypothetical protein
MEPKGFFASLYDFSFTSLVSTKIIKAVYVLLVVVTGIFYVIAVISGFANGAGSGFVALFAGGIGALLFTIYVRIGLEFVIAVFRIMETNTEIAAQGRGEFKPAAGAGPVGTTPTVPGL